MNSTILQFSRKTLFALGMIIVFIGTSLAQSNEPLRSSAKKKPFWVNTPPKGDFYNYISGLGIGNNLKEAQTLAITDALNTGAIEESVQVRAINTSSSDQTTTSNSNNTQVGDSVDNITSSSTAFTKRISDEVVIESSSDVINGFGMEETYWEQYSTSSGTEFRYYVLMRVPKKKFRGYQEPPVPRYGWTPFYQSAIVPGWGQYTKGSKVKAYSFMGLFTVSAAYTIYANLEYDKYAGDLSFAGSQGVAGNEDAVNVWNDRRSIGLIATVAIYALNLIDAKASKGKKLYAYHPPKKRIEPILTANKLGFTINF